jgi:hypothetical protein
MAGKILAWIDFIDCDGPRVCGSAAGVEGTAQRYSHAQPML